MWVKIAVIYSLVSLIMAICLLAHLRRESRFIDIGWRDICACLAFSLLWPVSLVLYVVLTAVFSFMEWMIKWMSLDEEDATEGPS